MKKTIFIQDENALWLKGNIHSHTVFSDGHWTPEQMKAQYRSHGYDFLAVTDHDVYTDTRALTDDTFTMIQGFELWGNAASNDKDIHINFLWADAIEGVEPGQKMSLPHRTGKDCMELCYRLKEKGAYIMLNHPHWSFLTSPEIEDKNPYDAVEIMNYATEWLENMGDGSVFWTEMLVRGCHMWNGGSDDNHNGHCPIDGDVDNMYCDSFGGFTVVKAADRSPQAIMEAMKAGSFYTSTGPSIYDFYVEDGYVHVKCSPCIRIYINGNARQYQRKLGRHVTEFVTKLKGTETFIRAECMDAAGRSAWSNPIWLDGSGEK